MLAMTTRRRYLSHGRRRRTLPFEAHQHGLLEYHASVTQFIVPAQNIAPLHELVPWNEAENHRDELLEGKEEWSSIGKATVGNGAREVSGRCGEAWAEPAA
jgi:hypothetical protein